MRFLYGLLLGVCAGLATKAVVAHSIPSGYVEIVRQTGDDYRVLWTMPRVGGVAADVDLVFDPGCALLVPPSSLATPTRLTRTETIHCSGGLAGKRIAARGLEATETDMLVRLVDRGDIGFARLTAASPWLELPAVAAPLTVARTYVLLGVEHILTGFDHLLFVLALMLLVPEWRRLAATITAFTVAHSVTLAAAVLGWVHVPQPPVEAAIALSIFFVAVELSREGAPPARGRAEKAAFAFGLLHGFGFAGALRALGVPAGEAPLSLLFFNLGVELGQLVFVGVALGGLALFGALRFRGPAWVGRVPAYVLGSFAAVLGFERIADFWS